VRATAERFGSRDGPYRSWRALRFRQSDARDAHLDPESHSMKGKGAVQSWSVIERFDDSGPTPASYRISTDEGRSARTVDELRYSPRPEADPAFAGAGGDARARGTPTAP
jgi:hypothetical protein